MKPLVVTPCHGDKACINYISSILKLFPKPEFYFNSGSLITQLRNECVEHFRAGSWTHLFFIDSDIGFEPEAFLRLLFSGFDVVAAPYSFRSDDTLTQGGFAVDGVGEPDDNGFAIVDHAPTGFMCIARSVFERMAASGTGRHEFFDTMRIGDDYLTEDFAFCRRWRDCGGTVHLDTRASLSHQGTKLYQRDFQTYLREKE